MIFNTASPYFFKSLSSSACSVVLTCIDEMAPVRPSRKKVKVHEKPHNNNKKHAEDQDFANLPAHVAALKDGLLDFRQFIGLEALMLELGDEKFEDELIEVPVSAYKTDGCRVSQRASEREFIEDARVLAENAKELQNGSGQSSEWQKLFRILVKRRANNAHESGYVQYIILHFRKVLTRFIVHICKLWLGMSLCQD